MTELEPIIYIISAIGVEIVKDVSKHLGKKVFEIEESLHSEIIQLGISDFRNSEEIKQKLESKPEIKAVIEQKIQDNQANFDEVIEDLKKHSKLAMNNFYSENNEKVINIGTNNGPINM